MSIYRLRMEGFGTADRKPCLSEFFKLRGLGLAALLFHPGFTAAQMFRGDIYLSDPYVMADSASRTYYMTGTGGEVFKSTDLEVWYQTPWPLNTGGIPWIGRDYTASVPGQVWAPELYHRDGAYYDVVTFTNPDALTEGTNHVRRSIHILKSQKPEGPYSKIEGGDETYLPATKMAIDGTIWEEDGKPYLVYCHEWVQTGDGAIEYVELKPDLTGTVGSARTICRASEGRDWNDSPVTDGPFVFRTKTGRLGMVWTSWRKGAYVQSVSYSAGGRLGGKWTHATMPVTPDDYGHGMLFRSFDGQLLMSVHSNRNIDLDNQQFERHPALFVVDDSGDELRVVMQYRSRYGLRHPAEVVVRNAGFDYSVHGWGCTSDAANKGIASNQGGAITGNYYECWDGNSFTGEIYQESELPNGTYRLTAAAFRSYPMDGIPDDDGAVCLFAGERECPVTSATPETYSVTAHVTDGKLRFGIRSARRKYQWMGIDNVRLTYYGEEMLDESDVEDVARGGDAVYLMNRQTGTYLNCGQNWGTQAVLSPHALDLYLVELPDGKYALDSKVSNGGTNHYLGTNGYVDSEFAALRIEKAGQDAYTISADGAGYMAADGDVVRMDYTAVSPSTLWVVKRKKDLLAELASAGPDRPVDATFLVKGAGFGRNDTRVRSCWSGGFVTGGNASNECAEASDGDFDVWQEVEGIPDGTYELRAQGFCRRDAHGEQPYFYLNGEQVPVTTVPASSAPADLEAASNAFSSGLYAHKLFAKVTGGKMRLGIRKAGTDQSDGSRTVFDNFELYYWGDETPQSVVDQSGPVGHHAPSGVYDLTGRRLRERAGDVRALPDGIYVVDGKKTFIRR